jgi:hypothetical protein
MCWQQRSESAGSSRWPSWCPALRALGRESTNVAARAFNRVAWPAFGVLVVTGVWNVLAEREHISGRYETTLVVKICLVAASGLSAALHSRSRSRAGLPYSEHWVEPQRSALCSSGSCSPSDRRAAVRFDCSGGTPVAPGPDDRVLEPVRCTPGVHTRRTYHCVPPVETSCGCGSVRVDDDGAFRAPAIPYHPLCEKPAYLVRSLAVVARGGLSAFVGADFPEWSSARRPLSRRVSGCADSCQQRLNSDLAQSA